MAISSVVLVAAIVLGTTTQPSPPELRQAFSTPDGITISLPEGWRQVPQEAMDTLNERMAKGVSETGAHKFDYAFQKWSAAGWFKAPLILVKVIRSGRVPEPSKFREALQEGMRKGIRIGRDTGQILSEPQFEETAYDPSGPTIWIRSQVKGGVEITAAKLTDFGAVYITCCSSQADASQDVPLFESVLKSVAIAEDIRYKPMLARTARFESCNTALIGWIFIGLIVLVSVVVVRRRMLRTMRALGVIFISMAWLTILGMVLSVWRLAGPSGSAPSDQAADLVLDFVGTVFWVIVFFSLGRYLRRKGRTARTSQPAAAPTPMDSP